MGKIAVGTMVKVNTNYLTIGEVEAISTKKGVNLYKVKGNYYEGKDLTIQKMRGFDPTMSEMEIIKKEFPIFKKGNISIVYECGKLFAFHYKKGDYEGYRFYNGSSFTPMSDSLIKKLAYGM